MKTLTQNRETLNDIMGIILVIIAIIAITPFGWIFVSSFVVSGVSSIVISITLGSTLLALLTHC